MVWAAVLAVAVAVGVGGWYGISARAAEAVNVTWSPQSPRCSGTVVNRKLSGPVIRAVAGMRCVITVRISSDAPVDVHLQSATAPYVGPGTGTVVTATNADAGSPEGGLHAQYSIDRTLASGTSRRFDLVIGFHPAGCNDSGRFRTKGWPKVRFTVLGWTHERSADQTFSFHRSGPTHGCPHH